MAAGAPAAETAPILVEDERFVAFDHVAAGHEGIQTDASSGSLVIKPCTPAEIAFYESAAQHQGFESHMPKYLGKLTLNSNQSANAFVPETVLKSNGLFGSLPTDPSSTSAHANGLMTPISPETSFEQQPPAQSQSTTSKRTSWQPSGGKKLDTGLAIVLENVAHGFTRPNIMDVKLGSRLWADDAPVAKRLKLDDSSHQTTSGSLGFRITGMTVWKGGDEEKNTVSPSIKPYEIKNGYQRYDKLYGRGFTEMNVKNGFLEYFGGVDENGKLKQRRSKMVIKRMARELESIQYVLENEESRMFSASILMIYEGDEQAMENALGEENTRRADDAETRPDNDEPNADDNGVEEEDDDNDDENEDTNPKVYDVRLIDFAHAQWTPGQGPDENALLGVKNVLKILYEIVEQNGA